VLPGLRKGLFRSDHGTNFRLHPFVYGSAGADELTPTSTCGGGKMKAPLGPWILGLLYLAVVAALILALTSPL
jgi:hypothetical protein